MDENYIHVCTCGHMRFRHETKGECYGVNKRTGNWVSCTCERFTRKLPPEEQTLVTAQAHPFIR